MDIVVCPGCRTWTADRIDVRTLDRTGDVLACVCGRRYPIIDGVPLVLDKPGDMLRADIAGIVERDLPPEVAALLVDGGDDAPYARLQEHLSIYLDAQWGDRATPPPDGPGEGFGLAAVVERLAALPRVGRALELGASVGRVVAELARTADHVVGVDLHFGALRRARKLLAGERLAYNRRVVGRHYTTAEIVPGELATDRVSFVCSNALDPPLVPGAYDRVVAINLLDSVASPSQLLAVMDGLCATGGELVLASPFAWQSGVMADTERLGGADPAATVSELLRTGAIGATYRIEDEAELPWTLRRDARSALVYRTHYVRARKL
ncbi:MAG: methyltransferase domain-containing protein [Kofleriaceae bacterium]